MNWIQRMNQWKPMETRRNYKEILEKIMQIALRTGQAVDHKTGMLLHCHEISTHPNSRDLRTGIVKVSERPKVLCAGCIPLCGHGFGSHPRSCLFFCLARRHFADALNNTPDFVRNLILVSRSHLPNICLLLSFLRVKSPWELLTNSYCQIIVNHSVSVTKAQLRNRGRTVQLFLLQRTQDELNRICYLLQTVC